MLEQTNDKIPVSRGILALSPVILFLLLYVAVSISINDFYAMPISVAMTVASIWGVIVLRGRKVTDRVEVFTKAAAKPDILYMICIFILAGAFAHLAKEIGAVQATVDLTIRVFPAEFLVPGLFIAACFISLSIGTSVGTVVALTPLAIEIADTTGAATAFYVATVLGGAFFGDNLSFISDTTIAATRTQGCKMNDKFKANLWIVLPAAIITLIIYIVIAQHEPEEITASDSNLWLVIPYLSVIILAVCGINVTIVLICGIIAGVIVGLFADVPILSMVGFMGEGIDSMGSLVIITLLAAGLLGIVKAMGGIRFLLQTMTKSIRGSRGAQSCIVFLVGIVNLCTANNTIAILTVGSISHKISERFGIDSRKTASLLDTCSCVVQSLIPYGAQTLIATSFAEISPISTFPYMYYSWVLAVIVIFSIVFRFPRYLNK